MVHKKFVNTILELLSPIPHVNEIKSKGHTFYIKMELCLVK
jgi:hypothetical protein